MTIGEALKTESRAYAKFLLLGTGYFHESENSIGNKEKVVKFPAVLPIQLLMRLMFY